MKTFLALTLTLGVAMAHADSLPDFDSLWNYDQPTETEAKFRALLPAAEQSGDTAYLAELMTQIARTLGLQQQFDSAHALLDSVEKILPQAGERPRVRYLLERGRAFNSSKRQLEAMPLFTEAWERAVKAGLDNFAVDAAHMCAIAAPAEQKLDWNIQALAVAEKSSDTKARNWLGSLYNNMGWEYFEQKQYDTALNYFNKAWEFRKTQNRPVQTRIAKWCVAKALRYLGKTDTALAMQQELKTEWESSGDSTESGYVYEELAECLLTLGRTDEATPYFASAYKVLSEDIWLRRDEPDRIARLKKLGKVE